MTIDTFAAFELGKPLLRALDDVGYAVPTPIQARAVPKLLAGHDLLGVAQTGTGKTAAFALPLLDRLDAAASSAPPKKPSALILAPTRELTVQIHDEFASLGRHTRLRQAIVIGGVGENRQIRTLARGVDILVATPGRLLDLADNGHVDLSEVSILVLDEADRLLDMGFIRDVRRIVARTPDTRQSLLFSATMPKEVARLAREILTEPVRIDVSPKQVTVKEIEQYVVHVANSEKQRTLECLLHDQAVSRAIVFTRTKHGASRVAKKLERAGICAEAIHGNKSQNARQRALQSFKTGDAWVLVATDIAARGIDIEGVSHVVNYELPHEPESYVHRIGRTARAGASGIAWSLVDPDERKRLKAIEKLIGSSPTEKRVDLPPVDESIVVANERRPGRSDQSAAAGRRKNAQTGNGSSRRPSRRRRRRRVA